MKAKYVNPFTDFGFKKIFGEEASKPMLIDFLSSLLPESNIVDLTFKDKEKFGQTEEDRKAIYDIYCENKNGEKIIVELQKAIAAAKQNYFKDRTIYYASFPIQEQAERGEWNYSLKSIYCIGILDFKFDDDKISKGEVIHTVELKDQNNQVFYDKLKFVYLEMPHFNKKETELTTRLDEWLYFIKNLEDFQSVPSFFKDHVFEQAFEKAEIAKYSEEEKNSYQQSLKIFRDNKATYDYAKETAYDEGRTEGEIAGKIEGKIAGIIEGKIEGKIAGIIEGKIEIAKKLKSKGMDIDFIIETTGLSENEINSL